MSVRTYLPSAQFLVLAGALVVSGGAVAAAQYYVSEANKPSTLASTQQPVDDEWTRSLAEIQAESGISLPEMPDEGAIESLMAQAQSDNLTDSIGRSLLVRLASAGTQGFGDDIPTQEAIIAEATARINASQTNTKAVQLSLIDTSDLTLRSYGNAAMRIFAQHPAASSEATLLAIAKATDNTDPAALNALGPVGSEYRAIANSLAALEVPRTLEPLHRQVVQNMYAIADTYPNMQKVISDPLKGLAALQSYQLLMGETGRILTNIAEALNKGGILFSKDEPGSAWEIFLSAS